MNLCVFLMLIAFFGLLYVVQFWDISIYLIAPFFGISKAFYWVPTNGMFAKNSHDKSSGKEASYLMLASRLGAVSAPMIGGAILTALTFKFFINIENSGSPWISIFSTV